MHSLRFIVFLMLLSVFLMAPSSYITPVEDHPNRNREITDSATAMKIVVPEQDALSLGYARYRDGRYEDGARFLQTFLTGQIEPDKKEAALVLLGECYYHMIDENPKVNMQLMLDTYKKFIRLFPNSTLRPKALYRVAGIFYRQKMFQKAIIQYQKIMLQYPDSPYVALSMFYMGKCLVGNHQKEQGLKVIQEVIEKYPGHPVIREVQLYLIDHDMKLEKYQEVLKRFAKLSNDLILSNPELRQMYPEVLFHLGHYKEAQDFFFKVLNVYPDDPHASLWSVRIGDIYYQEKLQQDALKIYYQTLERFPESEGAIMARAGILDVRNEDASHVLFEKILEGYDKLLADVAKGPLHGLVLMRKAMLLYRNNDLAESIRLFNRFFSEYPDSPYRNQCKAIYLSAFRGRIKDLFQQRKYPEVVDLMQQNKHHLTLKMVSSDVGWMIAESHYQVAFYHTAAAMMEELVRLDDQYKDNETLLFELGETRLELGEIEQSMEKLQDLLERFPESPFAGDIYALKGRQAFLSGDVDKTIDYCNTALEKVCRRRVADAYYYLGCAYREKGDVEPALEMFQKALENEEKNLPKGEQKLLQSARFALGDLLYDLGKKNEAMKIYQDAVGRYPDDKNADWAQYRMALIQADHGNATAALETLQGIQRETDGDLLGLLIRTADSDIRWHQKVAKML